MSLFLGLHVSVSGFSDIETRETWPQRNQSLLLLWLQSAAKTLRSSVRESILLSEK